MLATKNSPALCEMATDLIPTVLDSLLLVEFRKTIGISIANVFLRQSVILLSYLQKNLVQLWDFGRFSLILQRKISNFKSCSKCWQAIHGRDKLSLRRSSAFGKRENKFGATVPFKVRTSSSTWKREKMPDFSRRGNSSPGLVGKRFFAEICFKSFLMIRASSQAFQTFDAATIKYE